METGLKVGDEFTGKTFVKNGVECVEKITITEIKKSIVSDRINIRFTHENVLNTCSDSMWLDAFQDFITNYNKV